MGESQKLLPIEKDDQVENHTGEIMYDFEPNEEVILDDIIPKNIAIQIHSALLENLASEQGSRMTAMDNATRNANDMIATVPFGYVAASKSGDDCLHGCLRALRAKQIVPQSKIDRSELRERLLAMLYTLYYTKFI